MDYQRYLELAERFFEKAGIVFKKKGTDYPATDGAPSFILVDESRKAYYLLEFAVSTGLPGVQGMLKEMADDYADTHGIDQHVLSIIAALGKNVSAARISIPDKNIDSSLQQKTALVLSENMVPQLNDYLQSQDLDYQIVPLKGIFAIYLFNQKTSGYFEEIYKELTPQEKQTFTSTSAEGNAGKQMQAPSPAPAITDDTIPELSGISQQPDVIYTEEAQGRPGAESTTADQPFETPDGESAEPIYHQTPDEKNPADDAAEKILDKYGKDAPEKNITLISEALKEKVEYPDFQNTWETEEESAQIPEQEPQADIKAPEIVHDDKEKTAPPPVPPVLGMIFRHTWAFIAFAPAYLLHLITRGRVPKFVIYWAGGMCVLLGMYYYPLTKGLSSFINMLTAASVNLTQTLTSLLNVYNADHIIVSTGAPFNILASLNGLFHTSLAIISINSTILQFMNSPYYLQFALAFGYFMAMVPAWRIFGKQIITFFIVFYLLFLPSMLLGNSAIKLIADKALILPTLTDAAGMLTENTIHSIYASASAILLIAVLVPVIVFIFATRASRGKVDAL